MWAGPDIATGVDSPHATGTGVTHRSLATTGPETSARSMQHGEPGDWIGWLRSCPAAWVLQQDPVAAFAAFDAESDTGASWHSTPARLAEDEAYAVTMQ